VFQICFGFRSTGNCEFVCYGAVTETFDLREDELDPMSSFLARPQFRTDLLKDETLGIQKTLEVVRIVLIGS